MDKPAEMSDRPRARDAIMDAFRDILLEHGYEKARVLDIVARSGVARSTFYEHFQHREDVLRDSLRGVFQVLAQVAHPSCDVIRVTGVFEHLAENRAMVKSLMVNPGTDVLVEVFSEEIETRASVSPVSARAVAGAVMALLSVWLDGDDAHTAAELAQTMHGIGLALPRAVAR